MKRAVRAGAALAAGVMVVGAGWAGWVAPASAAGCLSSGTSADIQAALDGPEGIARLCPGATFDVQQTIRMTRPGQQIFTEGTPGQVERAKLSLANVTFSSAITASGTSDVLISNIEVDGGHRLGDPNSTDRAALISLGGMRATGQTATYNKLANPRGWTALHISEGYMTGQTPGCQNATVTHNVIGPAGTPTGVADGISLACGTSTVTDNIITDATDGAIVVFGAKGSRVANNTIIADTRELLGGINMVDTGINNSNTSEVGRFTYEGTVVEDNVIEARNKLIHNGIAMGELVWACRGMTVIPAVVGGTVRDNVTRGDYMGFSYAANGTRDWTAVGNVDTSIHNVIAGMPCGTTITGPNDGYPMPQGFAFSPERALGDFQPEFQPTANLRYNLQQRQGFAPGTVIELRQGTAPLVIRDGVLTRAAAGEQPARLLVTMIGTSKVTLQDPITGEFLTIDPLSGLVSFTEDAAPTDPDAAFFIVHDRQDRFGLQSPQTGQWLAYAPDGSASVSNPQQMTWDRLTLTVVDVIVPPTPTPTPSPTPTPTDTPSPTPTPTDTPSPTPTPTAPGTPTASVSPTDTPSPTSTPEPSDTESGTPVATGSAAPTGSGGPTQVPSKPGNPGGVLPQTGPSTTLSFVGLGIATALVGAALIILSRRRVS